MRVLSEALTGQFIGALKAPEKLNTQSGKYEEQEEEKETQISHLEVRRMGGENAERCIWVQENIIYNWVKMVNWSGLVQCDVTWLEGVSSKFY